jgi:hypothetical protein
MLKQAFYDPQGGPIEIHVHSGHLQPAICSIDHYNDVDSEPRHIASLAIRDGVDRTASMAPPDDPDSLLATLYSVALLAGKQYHVHTEVRQKGQPLASDESSGTGDGQTVPVALMFNLRKEA